MNKKWASELLALSPRSFLPTDRLMGKVNWQFRILQGLVLLSLAANTLFGQALTSLTGTIYDPTGAAVPNATLVLQNTANNASRETTSNASGVYVFAQVIPGEYKLTAKAQGFNDTIVNRVRLLVATPATINVTFEKVGTVAQTVEVSADSVQVNTSDATLGNSFGTKPIVQLPFNARNVVGLLALQPGVTFTADSGTATDRSGSVNGGKSDQANVTLDGVDVNDQQTRAAFTSVLRVTLDSVQEFRVTTTGGNADVGRTSGAQIQLVTKSGTNEFHGSSYYFIRNRVTNANSFFNNLNGVPLAKLNRHIYGASVGGPIKQNKAFFFLNYEGRLDRSEQSVVRVVPTQSLRDGLVKYLNTSGGVVTLNSNDLATRLDPRGLGVNQAVLRDVLSKYPLPNSTEQGDQLNTAAYRFNAPIKLRQNTYIAKLDYQLGTQTNLFIRGNLQNDNDTDPPQFPGQPPNNTNLNNSKGLAVGVTSSLRPNLISVFRYGYTRQGLENTGISRVNQIGFRTISDLFGLDRSFRRISPTHHLTQDFTWVKGKHNFQFGGSVRHYANDRLNFANSFFAATGNASWMSGSGGILNAPFTDMLPGFRVSFRDAAVAAMGLVTQVTSRYNYLPRNGAVVAQAPGEGVPRNFRGEEYEMYFQDSWRLTRNLTMVAGLRYSFLPPVYEANGVQTNSNIPLSDWFDRRVAAMNAGQNPTLAAGDISYVLANGPGGRPLYDTFKNWAPRMALAYAPTGRSKLGKFLFGDAGKTSIRAGWGMYYDLVGNSLIRNFDASALGLSTSINNPSGRLTLNDVPRFTGLNDIPASLITPAPPAAFPVRQPNTFSITNSLDDRLRAPYTMNMNFSVGREFKDGFFAQVSYVGRLSRRSVTSEDMAMPANIRDPRSGTDWYTAASQLQSAVASNVPVASIAPVPYFENMFPGAAGNGRTATQNVYNTFRNAYPDTTFALELLDTACSPSCSVLGPYAYYSPQYSYLRALRSVGGGSYHSMQFQVRKRWRNGDQIDFNYTLGKSIDLGSTSEDNAGATRGVIIQAFQRRLMRAVSDYDTLHQFNANWVVAVPFGRDQKFLSNPNRFVEALLGGWQVTGLYRQSSGFPTSVGNGRFWPTNYNVTGYATALRPVFGETNKNGPRPTAAGLPGPNLFADPAAALSAFDYTMPGQIGGRNNLRGDGIFNIDLGLGKRWKFNEKHSVQFRWEVFNATNAVTFDPLTVSADLGNINTFGRYQGTFTNPRIMQFALRYEF